MATEEIGPPKKRTRETCNPTRPRKRVGRGRNKRGSEKRGDRRDQGRNRRSAHDPEDVQRREILRRAQRSELLSSAVRSRRQSGGISWLSGKSGEGRKLQCCEAARLDSGGCEAARGGSEEAGAGRQAYVRAN